MARPKGPESVEIRTYQVGFGDCFMITFEYADRDRHVLIDFGSMARPQGARGNHMLKIARQIKVDCDGSLDVVVATHRHKDHISGFATNKRGNAPGNIIASLNPKMVIQPWTENPKAPKNATDAEMTAVRGFTNLLEDMHSYADAALRTAKALKRRRADKETVRQLEYLGQDNVKNRSAVENLMTMGKNFYVNHGDRLPIAQLLPGVKIHVLGPPSLKQSKEIGKQRRTDAEEFWHLQAAAAEWRGENGDDILFPDFVSDHTPIYARWLRYRLRNLTAEMVLSIVTSLDKQMNNTSLILLFEVGDKFMLFPGDAQIENWRYALSKPRLEKLLRKVDVYKVGHHGSLNATPKTLWNLFDQKARTRKPGRMRSLLSTREDVHGHEHAGTEVPRTRLVSALRANTDFLSTQNFEESEICRVVRL